VTDSKFRTARAAADTVLFLDESPERRAWIFGGDVVERE
jgi:hypothetical protein